MKRTLILSVVIILIVIVGLATFISYTSLNKKPFYVGVTFGGNTAEEAKQLIDKVKGYTNLFVITSGSMQRNISELETTCDYAVKSGLDVIVYFSPYETQRNTTAEFIGVAQERWNSHFLGVYNGDEPGGKMLDSDVYLGDVPNLGNVSKGQYSITISQINGSIRIFKEFSFSGEIYISYTDLVTRNSTTYFPNGIVRVLNNTELENPEILNYLPNGTVTLQEGWLDSPVIVTNRGSISQFTPYQEVWDSRPLRTSNDQATVATAYVNTKQAQTEWVHNQADIDVFTSDYALYWWDYLGG